MPKFAAYGKVVGTKYLGTFEAPDAEAAMKMAEEHAWAGMCHQCSSECEDPEVEDITVEPVEPVEPVEQEG